MLERYTITLSNDEIRNKYKVDPTPGYHPVYNAAPTHLLPVITHLHPDGFSFFYWGLPPEMTKNKSISQKLINAEVNEITDKISYRNAKSEAR